jgi:long-chain fatty acid transport protein
MKNVSTVTVAAALLLCSSGAWAAGFGINEHSARAMAMGGAFTAIADSPAAIFFNPAGMVQQEGLNLELGATMIAPSNSYTGLVPGTNNEVEVDGVAGVFLLPNIYASYRIHEMVSAGIGFYLPYGLTVEWKDTVDIGGGKTTGWWGRGVIEKITLQTMFINPTVAVQIHPRVMVGAGLTIIPAHVEFQRAVTSSADPADDVDVRLAGDDLAFSATAGVLVKVLPDLLNVGLTYRGGASFNFEGQAAFSKDGSPNNIPPALRQRLIDGPVAAPMNLPHVISFGLAAFPTEKLNIGFNLDVITWSVYEQLQINFTETEELSSTIPKNWRNTISIRLGAEYKVLDNLAVRTGFVFDQAPEPAYSLGPELPDGDRYIVNIGAGYKFDMGLYVDLAYMWLTTGESKTGDYNPVVGSYKASAHLVGLSVGYGLSL